MEFSSGREKWNTKLFRVVNSSLAFCTAFVLVQMGYFFILALVASSFGYKSIVTIHGITFLSPASEWYLKSIVVTFFSGFVFLAFSAIICFVSFRLMLKYDTPIQLLFLWLSIISFCMMCAEVLLAALGLSDFHSPFFQGLAIALAWMYVQPLIAFIAAFGFVLLFVGINTFLPRNVLILAYSYRKVEKLKNRRKYFVEVAMIPAVIGIMYAFVLIFPEKQTFILAIQLGYVLTSMILGWYVLFYINIGYDEVTRHQKLEKFNFLLLILFIVLTYLAISVADKGIKIG